MTQLFNDKNTLLHRSQNRWKNIIKTAWSGLFARIVTISITLMMMPLAVNYLGQEQYGLWVAATSLVALLGFMDGGAGNAVINTVAYASAANKEELPKIVATAFFSLTAVAIVGFLLFLLVYPFAPWGKLLGLSATGSVNDLNIVVLVVALFFFINMFATLVGKVQRGLQEGQLDSFWSAVCALLSLLLVYCAIQKNMGLVGVVIAFLLGPLLGYVASNIHYLFIRKPELRPRLVNFEKPMVQKLFAVGGMFFVLQITSTIQSQADNVIIAHLLGAAAVTNYAICMKLFLSISMLFGLIMAPLWPAYREAIASGDIHWLKQTFKKSIQWALMLSIPAAFLLILLGKDIIKIWIGVEAIPSTNLLVGCGIWVVLLTVGSALAVLLNSLQLLRIQLVISIISATANIVLTIYLVKNIGIEGAVWGKVIAYVVFVLLPYSVVLQKVFKDEQMQKYFSH